MKKQYLYGLIALSAIVIIVVLVIVLGRSKDTPPISLPSPTQQNGDNNFGENENRVEITPETVQAVLKTLKRPESYSREYTVTTYWAGGKGDKSLKLWHRDGKTRMSTTQNNTTKNILISGDRLSIWYDGSDAVVSSKLSDHDLEATDKYSALITYEELLKLSPDAILAAGYEDKLGEPCVFAEYTSGKLNYRNKVYVSTISGLLVSASIYDKETITYSMDSVSTELSDPPDDVFALPSTKKA
ncbi:MAG: hypothetical protein RRY47_03490 [Oscillospiraceae bacterium]